MLGQMGTLHTINNSPFESSSLESCLAHAKPGDAVLLIEDGVIGARVSTIFANRIRNAMNTCKIYALSADLAARGVDETGVLDGIDLVDYGGFVDLAVEHERTQAWL